MGEKKRMRSTLFHHIKNGSLAPYERSADFDEATFVDGIIAKGMARLIIDSLKPGKCVKVNLDSIATPPADSGRMVKEGSAGSIIFQTMMLASQELGDRFFIGVGGDSEIAKDFDRRFFAEFPGRCTNVRMPIDDERGELLRAVPEDAVVAIAVVNIADGMRARTAFLIEEGSDLPDVVNSDPSNITRMLLERSGLRELGSVGIKLIDYVTMLSEIKLGRLPGVS